jgi:predicted small metal-binding protein
MLKVSCADLGASCQWEATAETGEELRKKIWEHAQKAHKGMLAGLSEDDRAEMEARIDALIEMQGG